MFGLRASQRGKIMTYQDDLIEFRETIAILKKKKGVSKQQFESQESKFTDELNRY